MFSLAVVALLLLPACRAGSRRETAPDSSCHQQSIMSNHIIDVNASRTAGAVYISTVRPSLSQTCADVCCREPSCNLAVYRPDAASAAQAKTDQDSQCYLFNCQTPSVCKLSEHSLYAVAVVSRPAASLSDVVVPSSSIASPRRGVAFLSACHKGDTCEGLNTECSPAGLCVCKESYHHKNGVCRQWCDPATSYECVNGKADYSGPDCIAVYDVCNGIPECADGSDEVGCSAYFRPHKVRITRAEGAAWHETIGAGGQAAAVATAPASGSSAALVPAANAQQSAPATRQPAAAGANAAEQKQPGMASPSLPSAQPTAPVGPAAHAAADADRAATQLLAARQQQQDAAMTTAAAQRASAMAALVLSSLLALALAAYGVRRCVVGNSRAGLVHKVKAMGWAGKGDADYLVNGMYL